VREKKKEKEKKKERERFGLVFSKGVCVYMKKMNDEAWKWKNSLAHTFFFLFFFLHQIMFYSYLSL